jgi:hypothetical protein
MKLAELLSALSSEQLGRLAAEHIRSEEHLSRPTLCSMLEGVLRSFRLVQEIVFRRQPPAFSILCALMDAPSQLLPANALRDTATSETERLCGLVTSGEILGRDDQLRLYRRVLCETWRSDLQIDESESALLGVLRRELGIAPVEHFLLEHHSDLQEFWRSGDSYDHEVQAMMSVGLIFENEGNYVLASDAMPLVRQALGIDMHIDAARRLYGSLPSADIANALDRIGARTSGTKEERIERLLLNWVQPGFVLRPLSLGSLRDLCREMNAPASGNKDELVERIIARYASGSDQPPPEPREPAPIREDRALDERRFKLLFESLAGAELTRILQAFPDLKQSGIKETRAITLWDSHRSEATLLGDLMNREMEDILFRCGLKIGGSKAERIQRLIEHYRAIEVPTTGADERSGDAEARAVSDPRGKPSPLDEPDHQH